MIKGEHKVLQAFISTVITWAATAAGAAMVFLFSLGGFSGKRKILDFSYGFAGGIMTAASFWSLLAPAIDVAETSGIYGSNGEFAFAPSLIGFLLGCFFVLLSDLCITRYAGKDPSIALAMHNSKKKKYNTNNSEIVNLNESESEENEAADNFKSWTRVLLLIIAITVHNIPEGLAVGVGFGAIGSTNSTTFEAARNLAIGMCFQNFPEGMAVSIPLGAAGFSPVKSFWYGQLSGAVEPIFGTLGALVVAVANWVLPYASSFSAGAMIYVVFDDLIPEAQTHGNGRIATWGAVVGFVIMMCLDVGLGKI